MKTAKNPGSDLALIAAAGAGIYFFWPQLSSLFSGGSAAAPAYSPSGIGTPAPTPVYGGPPTLLKPATATTAAVYEAAWASSPAPQLTAKTISLAGIRRLGSAALVAQAALNQMRSDAGPQVTTNSPIGPWTAGAEQLPNGCWRYGNFPALVNCPPNTPPPLPRPVARGRCGPGYTMNEAGICARTEDQATLAYLNSTPYKEGGAVQTFGLTPTLIGQYVLTVGANPGSQLAALLGLPPNPSMGTMEQGNDGFNYLPVQGVYIRQGTATQATRPTGPIGPRIKLQGLGTITGALPITIATLIAASNDPTIAAMVATDPRAMLTLSQWNYFYTQATGIPQGSPHYPAIEPHAMISAVDYQRWRQAAGLEPEQTKLGIIHDSRPGAFPLGGISDGPDRQPFIHKGNNNIYRIPGRRSRRRLGIIHDGGGDHRFARSPFPRAADWRQAE